MEIRQATLDDLEKLANLFSQYRVFYQQPCEPDACRKFLEERISNKESIVFVAIDNDEFVGFTQLYPSFSSVGMKRIWILNDLFVAEAHRQKGVAQALINRVIEYSKKTGRSKVVLSTAYTNINAQQLYEKTGFVKDEFFNYEFTVR
jgi:ribosomal protein S18 acetylase RimI-like enzyme